MEGTAGRYFGRSSQTRVGGHHTATCRGDGLGGWRCLRGVERLPPRPTGGGSLGGFPAGQPRGQQEARRHGHRPGPKPPRQAGRNPPDRHPGGGGNGSARPHLSPTSQTRPVSAGPHSRATRESGSRVALGVPPQSHCLEPDQSLRRTLLGLQQYAGVARQSSVRVWAAALAGSDPAAGVRSHSGRGHSPRWSRGGAWIAPGLLGGGGECGSRQCHPEQRLSPRRDRISANAALALCARGADRRWGGR